MESNQTIDELVSLWEERLRAGIRLSPTDLCNECPELIPKVTEQLRALHFMKEMGSPQDSMASPNEDQSWLQNDRQSDRPIQAFSTSARYEIVRFHARGGLGEVLLARDDRLGRNVAIKVLPTGSDFGGVRRNRFLREVEVTSRLEHPGIVPVYAIGEDPSGRLGYAMRFIEGETLQHAIDRFHASEELAAAEKVSSQDHAAPSQTGAGFKKHGLQLSSERNLEFRELLRRFVDVCNAVAYAHSQNILHRDIKPSNIMLGMFGETIVVDWGLAKSIADADSKVPGVDRSIGTSADGNQELEIHESGADGLEQTDSLQDLTVPGAKMGTPAFMSPEQTRGDQVNVASDIYSLGVTLHVILTGAPPSSRLRGLQKLMEEQGELAHSPTVGERNPSIPPALHAICCKAMSSDPSQRYATAKLLAADIESWLADEPVSAFRDGALAKIGRWTRRHRTLTATIGVSLFVLLVSVSIGTILLERLNLRIAAQRDEIAIARDKIAVARDKAEKAAEDTKAISDFLADSLLSQARPEKNAVASKVTVRELLDRASRRISESNEFAGRPNVEAAIRQVLANTYLNLGEYRLAEPHIRRAVELNRKLFGAEEPLTMDTVNSLALILKSQGRLAEAEPLYRENLAAQERVLGPDHSSTLVTMNNLGALLGHLAKYQESESMLRTCLERKVRTLGADHDDTLSTQSNLSQLLDELGKKEEAETMMRGCLEVRLRVLGPDHPITLGSQNNLASMMKEQGKFSEAEGLYRQCLETKKRVQGLDHPDTLTTMNNLALLLQELGKLNEAAPMFKTCLELRILRLGPKHSRTLTSQNNLGRLLQDQGKLAESEKLCRQTLENRQKVLGIDHPETLFSMHNLATVLADLGRKQEAESMFLQTLGLKAKKLGVDHPDTLKTGFAFASFLAEEKRWSECEKVLLPVLTAQRRLRKTARNESDLARAISLNAWLAVQNGKAEQSESTLRDAARQAKESLPQIPWRHAEVQARLGGCLVRLKKFAEAESVLLESAKCLELEPPARNAQKREVYQRLIELYQEWGKPQSAEPWKKKLSSVNAP